MKKLYLESGYVNIQGIRDYGMPFNFIVGGRGTGKTYGAITNCLDRKEQFIYMRRTDTILQSILADNDLNPMAPIAKDRHLNIALEAINKYIRGWYNGVLDDDGKMKNAGGKPYGVAVGLSVLGNMRGWDASDYTTLIMDEFIAEPHERVLKEEADAFFNAYETINRNREFKGQPPMTVFFLANAFDLTNDYFIKLKLIDIVDNMILQGNDFYIDKERGITISLLKDSPISAKKKQTALYKLTKGTSYADMALNNTFTQDVHKIAKSMPLNEYRPVVKVGELVIYEHKSKNEYYACLHLSGNCKEYGTSEVDIKRFNHTYDYLYLSYLNDHIVFETYTTEALFRKFFK